MKAMSSQHNEHDEGNKNSTLPDYRLTSPEMSKTINIYISFPRLFKIRSWRRRYLKNRHVKPRVRFPTIMWKNGPSLLLWLAFFGGNNKINTVTNVDYRIGTERNCKWRNGGLMWGLLRNYYAIPRNFCAIGPRQKRNPHNYLFKTVSRWRKWDRWQVLVMKMYLKKRQQTLLRFGWQNWHREHIAKWNNGGRIRV